MRPAVLTAWRRQLRAMDEADIAGLAACFTPEARLVHMTGYSQPLQEWMAGIRAGEFVYHQVIEKDVSVEVDGDSAHLVGHIITGHRDDGSGQAWPLTCDQDYRQVRGEWLCTESRVTFGH